MKKAKGAAATLVAVLLSPELRPAEVKILRTVVVAVAAYLGVKFGTQA